MAEREYRTFAEFWPFYLREHSRPATRTLHYIGTALVIALAIVAVATGTWWLPMVQTDRDHHPTTKRRRAAPGTSAL